MTERILKETVIEEGDFLSPRIVVRTAACEVAEDSDKFFLYNYTRITLSFGGIAPNTGASTEKTYLRGKIKGLDQEINLEFLEEALTTEDLIEPFHKMGIIITEAQKSALKLMYLAKMAGA